MKSRALLVLAVISLASHIGCATSSPAPAGRLEKSHTANLEAYGPLLTTTVEVGGTLRRFLVDTGGGMTVFTPEVAASSGCAIGAPLTGFRMSGERIDAPRCEGASVTVAGWTSAPHTALIVDINKMVPPDWPKLDGLISLATFDGHVVTLDLPARKLVVDDEIPRNARTVRARFERSVTGLALGAFIATRNSGSDFWLEVDTGSDGAVILNEPIASSFGLEPHDAAKNASVELRLDDGVPISLPARLMGLRFDGNIGLAAIGTWVLTFDLGGERIWIRTP